jgi:putative hemolysin
MEDIIEEIVGEIHDEYDEVAREVEQASDGSVVVDARMSIHDFNAQFNASIPDASEYETVAGFLQTVTGKLPDVHEEIRFDNMIFTILNKSARRIRQVKFRRTPGQQERQHLNE